MYNILPDIISRLSDPQSGVSEELFSSIMKYLMVFIQKERQSESLVEKLCYRFRATRYASTVCGVACNHGLGMPIHLCTSECVVAMATQKTKWFMVAALYSDHSRHFIQLYLSV